MNNKKINHDMIANAKNVAELLKLIANPHRLTVLCALTQGPMNVSAMADLADINQTTMSNHLARLREAGIVNFQREHRELKYSLSDQRVASLLSVLYELYCKE